MVARAGRRLFKFPLLLCLNRNAIPFLFFTKQFCSVASFLLATAF
jgi:hypothetical protein